MKKVIIAVLATAALSTQAFAAGDAAAGKAKFGMCVTCHGAAGEGGVGPKLAGQAASDIVSKLTDYKAGKQRGPMTSMMAPMAAGLTDADVQNVAAYVSSL
ncbi:MAG: cytochrome c [Thiomicrorhabdus sp.]|nr:MAG: cytochrome c [Thiomicrorhabdus sp.]